MKPIIISQCVKTTLEAQAQAEVTRVLQMRGDGITRPKKGMRCPCPKNRKARRVKPC